MNAVQRLYDALARLLTYPDQNYRCHLAACLGALGERHPASEKETGPFEFRGPVPFSEAGCWMHQFVERIAPLSIEELQEVFTRTFDLNPVCSLEVGWHLFGENYSRGEFLVEMRQTLRRLGLPESTELPDHQSQVLPAVARLTPREAGRFSTQHLLPALEKMLVGLRGQDCPYECVLEAIHAVVLSPYGCAGIANRRPSQPKGGEHAYAHRDLAAPGRPGVQHADAAATLGELSPARQSPGV